MSLLDVLTGGASSEASAAQKKALAALQGVRTPDIQDLTLPELQQYAIAAGMSPAEMQAFLQQSNAFNKPVDQTGTAAQIAAINQLAGVANAGAEGSPTQRAQIAQVNQDAARNLAGQRGAIDQAAQARGVAPGMLQAALSQVQAGQGQQDAHMAALKAQDQNYQQALAAMASGGALGGQLQGQQNTQANTVAQAQNAMQQFNAANQQNASQQNAANRQQANLYNTGMANQVGQANTGLANPRTQYNAQLPQTVFNNQLAKATGVANQSNNLANTYTGQGQQAAGIWSGLLGTAGSVVGDVYGAPKTKNLAGGGVVEPYNEGGLCMPQGGMVPGRAKTPGDSLRNDTVSAKLSPGEAVLPRSTVQNNPEMVMQLLRRGQAPQRPAGHHPEDIAALLAAMRHIRGAAA
jgi:hypothetical protein